MWDSTTLWNLNDDMEWETQYYNCVFAEVDELLCDEIKFNFTISFYSIFLHTGAVCAMQSFMPRKRSVNALYIKYPACQPYTQVYEIYFSIKYTARSFFLSLILLLARCNFIQEIKTKFFSHFHLTCNFFPYCEHI